MALNLGFPQLCRSINENLRSTYQTRHLLKLREIEVNAASAMNLHIIPCLDAT